MGLAGCHHETPSLHVRESEGMSNVIGRILTNYCLSLNRVLRAHRLTILSKVLINVLGFSDNRRYEHARLGCHVLTHKMLLTPKQQHGWSRLIHTNWAQEDRGNLPGSISRLSEVFCRAPRNNRWINYYFSSDIFSDYEKPHFRNDFHPYGKVTRFEHGLLVLLPFAHINEGHTQCQAIWFFNTLVITVVIKKSYEFFLKCLPVFLADRFFEFFRTRKLPQTHRINVLNH